MNHPFWNNDVLTPTMTTESWHWGQPTATTRSTFYVLTVESTAVSGTIEPAQCNGPGYREHGGGRLDIFCGNRPPRRSRFEGVRHHQQPKLRGIR